MRLYRKVLRREDGFTLIEVAITIAVVIFALSGVLFANTAIQQAHGAAFERSVAIQEAHEVIEQMRNTANTGGLNFPVTVTAAYPVNTARPGFTRLTAQCGALANPAAACNWPFNFTPDNTSQEQIVVTYVNTAANPLDTTVTVVYRENGTRAVSKSLRAQITRRT